MPLPDEEFFLLIGGANSESTTSRITTEGLHYRRKLLYSRPENWRAIIELLENAQLKAVITVLTGNDYERFLREGYENVGSDLLDALSKVPHVVFIHEKVFFAENERSDEPVKESPATPNSGMIFHWYDEMSSDEFFGEISDDVRTAVNTMLNSRRMNVLPYRTNAERSIMAGKFIEDLDRHMLFRVYIPAGRLYAEEASTLLGLFRDWLNQTGRDAIRQDGYTTPAGHVYEFFGEKSQQAGELSRQFSDFSDFLESCHSAPEAALDGLLLAGVEPVVADQMVAKYAKAGRRLQLDLRQTREQRLLSLRHQLESELLGDDGEVAGAADWLARIVPDSRNSPAALLGASALNIGAVAPPHITVNQQFFSSVQGSVIQNLHGTAHFGPEAQEILSIIHDFGGAEAASLESSLHELEDPEARKPDRLVARQKVRSFLSSVGNQLTSATISTLQRYLEQRIGL